MTSSDFTPVYTRINQLINSSRLNESFSLIKNNLSKYDSGKSVDDRIEKLESTYRYLLSFMAEGHSDPSRDSVIEEIRENLRFFNDLLLQRSLLIDSSDLYSTLKRMEIHKGETFRSRLNELNTSLNLNSEGSEQGTLSPGSFEALNNLFNHVLTIFGASQDEYEEISTLLCDSKAPNYVKASVIGALLLGSIQYYNPDSLSTLLDAYENESSGKIKARLISAITLICMLYPERIASNAALKSRIMIMKQDDDMTQLINDIIYETVRIYDTKRVSAKMRDEVIPGLMKVNPDIIEKMRNMASDSEDFLSDINPDWEDIIEKSGIQDKLQEINDMQMDGSDVMMTTFSNLKGFAFFRNISNWFLPFMPEHPDLSSKTLITNDTGSDFFSLVMCDSDIYSFMLSLNGMPDERKTLVMKNMQQQLKQAEEMLSSAVGDTQKTKMAREIKHFLQDLYRFFKLYHRKTDFKDPFALPLTAEMLQSVSKFLDIQVETFNRIGDFFFKHKYYAEAADFYKGTDTLSPGNFSLWEKIGYCCDRLSQYPEATEWYKKSEIVNPDNSWLIKKLAISLKNSGRMKEALPYYERILATEPDNYHILMSAAQCLLDSGETEKALQHFYHALYLKPDKKAPERAVAWTLLISGNAEKAKLLYEKLTDCGNADKTDYLNAALCGLALNDLPLSIRMYKGYLQKTGNNDFRDLMTALREDARLLKQLGIPTSSLRLVIDYLRYNLLNG